MFTIAQAVAEYGALVAERGGGSQAVDGLMERATNLQTGDYVLALLVVLIAMWAVSKLLDAI
jgi:hypothetical protein